MANLTAKKSSSPRKWDVAIHEAGHCCTGLALNLFLYSNGAQINPDGGGSAAIPNYWKDNDRLNVRHTINSLAGSIAETILGIESKTNIYRGGSGDRKQQAEYMTEFCKKNGLDYDDTIKQLAKYARTVVKAYWPAILKVAERILATDQASGRHIRKVYEDAVREKNLKLPEPKFIGALLDAFNSPEPWVQKQLEKEAAKEAAAA